MSRQGGCEPAPAGGPVAFGDQRRRTVGFGRAVPAVFAAGGVDRAGLRVEKHVPLAALDIELLEGHRGKVQARSNLERGAIDRLTDTCLGKYEILKHQPEDVGVPGETLDDEVIKDQTRVRASRVVGALDYVRGEVADSRRT